jgi:hypothetical protein
VLDASNARTRSALLPHLIQGAATTLEAQGWTVIRKQTGPEDAWHVVARKGKNGKKLRVVQVVPPVVPSMVRQDRMMLLGETVRLPSTLGTMEQWLVHVRPGGYVTFGPYVLTAHRWPHDEVRALASLGLST